MLTCDLPVKLIDHSWVSALNPASAKRSFAPLDISGGHDQIHITGHQGLLGPMVDGHAANGAPGHLRTFQGFDQAQNIRCASPGLPIEELPSSHGVNIDNGNWTANNKCPVRQSRRIQFSPEP